MPPRKKPAPYPSFSGSLSLDPSSWRRGLVNPTVPGSEPGAIVEAYGDSPTNTLGYLYRLQNIDLALTQHLIVTVEIRVVDGTPVFHHTEDPNVGLPPNFRLIIGCYQTNPLGGPGSDQDGRWWSNPDHVELAPGVYQLDVPMDPARWSNINGQFGNTRVGLFDLYTSHSSGIGVTNGGGSSFGHGVYTTDGTAQMVITGLAVQ
jgi:hypothetical protein